MKNLSLDLPGKSRESEQMTSELFTSDGHRKYLTLDEQDRFIRVASHHGRAEDRTFALTLAYTGCRISGKNPRIDHRVPLHPEKVGGLRVTDEVVLQIDSLQMKFLG